MRRVPILLALLGAGLVVAAPAEGSEWFPHPAGASWTYEWVDSAYSRVPTREKVTVRSARGRSFTLAWTTLDQGAPSPGGASGQAAPGQTVPGQGAASSEPPSSGTLTFQETNTGVVNTGWSSTAPPTGFPVLCARTARCANSLASTYYNVVWGSRVPVLAEPLVKGLTWTSKGGAGNDVAASSRYLGMERVTVPAFSRPVAAAKVRTQITQKGALGDPYGSGTRTVWWAWGVGPVKVVFAHAGRRNAPITTAVLRATTLRPKPPPGDEVYFPLVQGKSATYRWTNPRHFAEPVVERVTTTSASKGAGRLSVASVSGPLEVEGTYRFTQRLDGLTNVSSATKSVSVLKLPPLGPKALPPSKRRRFVTPIDLMSFGFNPIVPAYAQRGDSWTGSRRGRDFKFYGVRGTSKVLGLQTVRVPAGTFRALAARTTLWQAGYPWGSGVRTSWFAPGKGLVKLVFRHGDGSVSQVARLK